MKTKPYTHQQVAYDISKDLRAFAYFMEMGTGKTKVVIDNASYLHQKKEITALVVICPNGLQRNWFGELGVHAWTNYEAAIFDSKKKEWDLLKAKKTPALKVFIINIDRLSMTSGLKDVFEVLKVNCAMLAIDESQRIKSNGANRTRNILKLTRHAEYRRILSGTPVTQGALDLYTQFKFLNPSILPYSTFTAFKHQYAIVKKIKTKKKDKRGRDIEFEKITSYKNLDVLKHLINPYNFAVRKEDCLDLPEKIFEDIHVELTPDQKRMYKQLIKEAVATIESPPEGLSPEDQIMWALETNQVSANNALTKILRCQQVLGGNVKDDDGVVHVVKSNRLNILKDTLEDIPEDSKVIIWARFRAEIDEIAKLLGDKAVEFHGGVNVHDRDEAVQRMQNDPATRYFIGQPASGGVGLTLTAANYVIWYSRDYSLENYLQANDRAHRIGQTKSVTYLHLVAPRTLDEAIQKAINVKSKTLKEFL